MWLTRRYKCWSIVSPANDITPGELCYNRCISASHPNIAIITAISTLVSRGNIDIFCVGWYGFGKLITEREANPFTHQVWSSLRRINESPLLPISKVCMHADISFLSVHSFMFGIHVALHLQGCSLPADLAIADCGC